MAHRRQDVVEHALAVLDTYGLGDLSMRRLGAELGVAAERALPPLPGQADPAGRRRRRDPGPRLASRTRGAPGTGQVAAICADPARRDAGLPRRRRARRDRERVRPRRAGAVRRPRRSCSATGLARRPAGPVAARTLLHFVLGHVGDEQTAPPGRQRRRDPDEPRDSGDFELGLGLILDGLRTHIVEPGRLIRGSGGPLSERHRPGLPTAPRAVRRQPGRAWCP